MVRVVSYAEPGEMLSQCRGVVTVLPIGSTEYHPGNLPLSIDSIIANLLARRLVEKTLGERDDECCVYILPPLNYGFSHEWIKYPGTVSLKPQTLINVVTEILLSLRRNTVLQGAIIVNGHGGNTGVLEAAARMLFYEEGLETAVIDIWRTASHLGQGFCHGCVLEAKVAEILGAEIGSVSRESPGTINCSGKAIYYCKDEMPTGVTSISGEQLINNLEKEFSEVLWRMLSKCLGGLDK